MFVLNDSDVAEILTWPKLIDALQLAFLQRQEKEAFIMPERQVISRENATYLSMPCLDSEGWFGVKQVSVLPQNYKIDKETVQAQYTLFDPSGTPVLTAAADLLTKMRTAAVSALAARYLVKANANSLLLIGTGSLAPYMAKAHMFVTNYSRLLLWGRNIAKAKLLSEKLSKEANMEFKVIKSLTDALAEADVVTIATTANSPIVFKDMTHKGQHFDIVGAFKGDMIELEPNLIKSSSVFVDDIPSCKLEAGDLIQAAQQGWSFEEIRADLSQIVSKKEVRKNDKEITVFKSVGLALEDLVAAKILYKAVS